jgi:hypothetical protein
LCLPILFMLEILFPTLKRKLSQNNSKLENKLIEK